MTIKFLANTVVNNKIYYAGDVCTFAAADENTQISAGAAVEFPGTISATGVGAFSASILDIYPSTSPADRFSAITATQGWEGTIVQEPNVWYANGYYHCLYSGGTTGASAAIGYAYTTTPGGTWTKPLTVPVIGNGHGGVAGGSFCEHTGLYIENSTIYFMTSLNPFTGSALLFSAPLNFNPASGPTFSLVGNLMSLPAGSSSWGNFQIIPITVGSSYALLYETLQTSDSVYHMGVATLSGALGSGLFTSAAYPLNTLATGISYYGPSGTKEAGGPALIGIENGSVLIYYHAGPSGSAPTDVFAASIPLASIATDGWTVLNSGFPVMRRQAQVEVDQTADPSIVQGPGGDWWIATTALFNKAAAGSVLLTPCYYASITTSNGSKVYLSKPQDNFAERTFNQAIFPPATTTTYSPRNRDSVVFNLGINNVTVTLPKAGWSVRVKISAFNSSAGRQVTVNAQGGDTLIGANTVQAGTTVTYTSDNNGWWTTDNPPFASPTTGAQTATFTATNKPGTGTNSPTAWLPYTAGGTTYYLPLFGA